VVGNVIVMLFFIVIYRCLGALILHRKVVAVENAGDVVEEDGRDEGGKEDVELREKV